LQKKTDDSLFVLDTGIESSKEEKKGPVSKRSKKDKALRCLALLQPDPHSKTVRTTDSETFKKGQRYQAVEARLKSRTNSKLRLQANVQSQKAENERQSRIAKKRKLPVVEEDIWGDSDSKGYVTVKPPKRYRKKPSVLSATMVPHPGASVNPALDDHQNLLLMARNKEVNKYKAEKKIFNAVDGKFLSREEMKANEATHLIEMSAGLVDDSESEEESDDSVDEYMTTNPPVRREDRKTRKQRRVELETEIQKSEKKLKTDVKQRENMVLRLPTLKAEINKKEKVVAQRRKKKEMQKEQEKFQTKRLGKVKYVEPDQDLKLSDELVGTLREIKPEGHVLADVYKSLQRRNIVEPRIRQKNKRKYKPKVFEKKGHKEVTLESRL